MIQRPNKNSKLAQVCGINLTTVTCSFDQIRSEDHRIRIPVKTKLTSCKHPSLVIIHISAKTGQSVQPTPLIRSREV